MDTKTCRLCGTDKPIDQFTVLRRLPFRLDSRCNGCRSAARRKRYADDPAHRAALLAEYKAYAHQRTPEKRRAERLRYYAANMEKIRARRAVKRARRQGRIPDPATLICAGCGLAAHAYHHHLGYSKEHRLDVQPVCLACHGIEHRKASNYAGP